MIEEDIERLGNQLDKLESMINGLIIRLNITGHTPACQQNLDTIVAALLANKAKSIPLWKCSNSELHTLIKLETQGQNRTTVIKNIKAELKRRTPYSSNTAFTKYHCTCGWENINA